MQAAAHIEPVVWRFYGPRQTCPGFRRIITGVRLRKLLRNKDLRTRAAKLTQDLDALIAVHLRRLRRRLTRILALPTRPQAAAMLPPSPRIAPTLVADTS